MPSTDTMIDARAPERALFARVGEALHGPNWQEATARDLGVSSRSVRYWLAGRHDIPIGIWIELRMLLLLRQKDLFDLIDEIPG